MLSQEWVWALKPEVRAALPVVDGYAYLPVQFNLSMLLGWAFYWEAIGYCNQSGSLGDFFHLGGK